MVSDGLTPCQIIGLIADRASVFACQAGVGGMETAGSIISYLAKHPEHVDGFLSGETSMVDWPIGWHEQGCLTWHGRDGKIYDPATVRRARVIRKLERGAQEQSHDK